MLVDSNEQQLNLGQIVLIFLKNEYPDTPPQHIIPLIIAELNHKGVLTKQFGNTIFEVIKGNGPNAFFKAFNADTGENYVENSKQFVVYARRILRLQHLVTQFTDPAIEQIFKIIASNPPLPGMSYQVHRLEGGQIQIDLNLGE